MAVLNAAEKSTSHFLNASRHEAPLVISKIDYQRTVSVNPSLCWSVPQERGIVKTFVGGVRIKSLESTI